MQGEAFVVGAIGNFSGWRHPEALEEHRSRARFFDIDRDNLDTVLARLAPRIQLDLPFCRTLRLSTWGDFHPDGLVERVPALQKLLEARGNVGNPPLMRRCLEQAGVDFTRVSEEEDAGDGRVEPAARPMDDGDLLDSMLGDSPGEGAAPTSPSTLGDRSDGNSVTGSFDRLIREIVDSSGDGTDYAQQDRWRAAIDAELSERMRALLRHPEFRRLEASWSALRDLVRHSDTGEGLRIRVLDYAREDLLAELAELGETPKLEESTLCRLVAESEPGLPGRHPFDLLVTDFRIDLEPESLRLLAYLLGLCERARVPLLAAAVGRAGDIRDASERELQAWIDLQRRPGASRIGLCTPEVLLRPPYGPETEPVESFAFDEDARPEQPETYAWGSASFAVARAVTRAYGEDGDLSDLARHTELENLPIHVTREDGEVRQQGPVREIMTEPRLEACQLMGLIPVVTPRGRDSLRIVALRSLGGGGLFAGSEPDRQ
jgi:type VI secretion system protein ImpC